ncbi:hypothetical protein H0X09_03200, partial [Candidatus Saccharibacteria bacterium]|nr:hypothetical protein [Candidatus Saccharibacteria bacterium]
LPPPQKPSLPPPQKPSLPPPQKQPIKDKLPFDLGKPKDVNGILNISHQLAKKDSPEVEVDPNEIHIDEQGNIKTADQFKNESKSHVEDKAGAKNEEDDEDDKVVIDEQGNIKTNNDKEVEPKPHEKVTSEDDFDKNTDNYIPTQLPPTPVELAPIQSEPAVPPMPTPPPPIALPPVELPPLAPQLPPIPAAPPPSIDQNLSQPISFPPITGASQAPFSPTVPEQPSLPQNPPENITTGHSYMGASMASTTAGENKPAWANESNSTPVDPINNASQSPVGETYNDGRHNSGEGTFGHAKIVQPPPPHGTPLDVLLGRQPEPYNTLPATAPILSNTPLVPPPNNTPVLSGDPLSVDTARVAVESAMSGQPYNNAQPEPITALGAQPMGPDLHAQPLPTSSPNGATPSLNLPQNGNIVSAPYSFPPVSPPPPLPPPLPPTGYPQQPSA